MQRREVPSRRSVFLAGALAATVLLWTGCATRGKPKSATEPETATAQGPESPSPAHGSEKTSGTAPASKPKPARAMGTSEPVPYYHPASPTHLESIENGLRPLQTISTGTSTEAAVPAKSEQGSKSGSATPGG